MTRVEKNSLWIAIKKISIGFIVLSFLILAIGNLFQHAVNYLSIYLFVIFFILGSIGLIVSLLILKKYKNIMLELFSEKYEISLENGCYTGILLLPNSSNQLKEGNYCIIPTEKGLMFYHCILEHLELLDQELVEYSKIHHLEFKKVDQNMMMEIRLQNGELVPFRLDRSYSFQKKNILTIHMNEYLKGKIVIHRLDKHKRK